MNDGSPSISSNFCASDFSVSGIFGKVMGGANWLRIEFES